MATMATRYNSEEGKTYFYELLMELSLLFLGKINWK